MTADSYSTSSLRFMLTDSSFSRRIGFAIMEKLFCLPSVGNYGYPADLCVGEDGTIVFNRNYKYETLEDAKRDIESIINKRKDNEQ